MSCSGGFGYGSCQPVAYASSWHRVSMCASSGCNFAMLADACRSAICTKIRSPKWWPVGVFTGLSYINMVAAWGGSPFPGVRKVLIALWMCRLHFRTQHDRRARRHVGSARPIQQRSPQATGTHCCRERFRGAVQVSWCSAPSCQGSFSRVTSRLGIPYKNPW